MQPAGSHFCGHFCDSISQEKQRKRSAANIHKVSWVRVDVIWFKANVWGCIWGPPSGFIHSFPAKNSAIWTRSLSLWVQNAQLVQLQLPTSRHGGHYIWVGWNGETIYDMSWQIKKIEKKHAAYAEEKKEHTLRCKELVESEPCNSARTTFVCIICIYMYVLIQIQLHSYT